MPNNLCKGAFQKPMNSGEHRIQLALRPTFEGVRETLICVREHLVDLSLDRDLQSKVEIVLGEVLNNVVEHAFGDNALTSDETDQIFLNIAPTSDSVRIKVEDRGLALPNHELPKGNQPDTSGDIASLPEGGFGWFLIKELAESVEYHRRESANCLELTIHAATAEVDMT